MNQKFLVVFFGGLLFIFNTLAAQNKWIVSFDFTQLDVRTYLDQVSKSNTLKIDNDSIIVKDIHKQFRVKYDFGKDEKKINQICLSHQIKNKKEIAEKSANIISFMEFRGEIFFKIDLGPKKNIATYFCLLDDRIIRFQIDKKKKHSVLNLVVKPRKASKASLSTTLLNRP